MLSPSPADNGRVMIQTRKTAAHHTTTPHLGQLHSLDPSGPPRAPYKIPSQLALYRRIESARIEDPLKLYTQSVYAAAMGRARDYNAGRGGQVHRGHG